MPILFVILTLAVAQAATQAPSITTAASKFVPGVTWHPESVVTADFSCRGRREQAILGVSAKELIAVFLHGTTERREVLHYSAAVRDANSAELTVESLDYDPKQEEALALPGFRRSRTCKGLSLSDGKVDSAHIYWNHEAKKFEDWVR